jgi:hypothetical protein
VNGDGELDGLGSANETAWPSGIKSAATTLNPYGHKGGGFAHAWDVNWVSERYYAANDYAYAFDYGAGRGVRAP